VGLGELVVTPAPVDGPLVVDWPPVRVAVALNWEQADEPALWAWIRSEAWQLWRRQGPAFMPISALAEPHWQAWSAMAHPAAEMADSRQAVWGGVWVSFLDGLRLG